MPSSRVLHGIAEADAEVCAWLEANMPRLETDPKYVTERKRNQRVLAKTKTIKERTRIRLEWRRRFAQLWKLNDETIVKASNIILRAMEQQLQTGDPVYIDHFGSFHVRKIKINGVSRPRILFKPSVTWIEELNVAKDANPGFRLRRAPDGTLVPRHPS